MHVSELMSKPVVTCRTDDTLDVPTRLMWEYDCGVVPVIDAEGRLAGMVTDRDIAMAAYTQGKALPAIPVSTAMAKDVLAVHPEESVEAVERLMREGQVRRVPVIDNTARPVGVVSINDLARLTAQARKSGVDRELVETLAAVCRPRTVLQEPHELTRRPDTALRATHA
jgi:CBS domain-containing protein